jgi:hypothetical protein
MRWIFFIEKKRSRFYSRMSDINIDYLLKGEKNNKKRSQENLIKHDNESSACDLFGHPITEKNNFATS